MSAESPPPGVSSRSAPEPHPGRRKRRTLVWSAVLLASVGLIWWVFRGRERAPRHAAVAPVTVVAAAAQRADMPVTRDAIGTVTPVYTNQIASQVTGQVMSVSYKEGQLVERGTPLVDIDPRPFEATLLQAQGVLERDTQVLAQAKMDLQRYRAAWAKNAIAKQQLDDQEKLVLQTEGTVKNDRGTVKYDQVQLSYCHITAPIVGRVGLRLVDPGNLVAAASGTTLAVITQLQPISVVFTVSEDDLGPVLEQTRQGAHLSVDAMSRTQSKRLATGTLITIDNQIDTTTGTVKLRALFDNQDEALFPNQFVNTRLLVRTLRAALTLPSSAIQHDGTEAFVFVIKDGHVHMQHVTTGVIEGDTTQIEGIAPGTLVANSSFEKLQDGVPVATASGTAAPRTAELGSAPR